MRPVTPKRKFSREQKKLKQSKNAFRQQVMEDLKLTYAARVVGYWLADYMDYRATEAHFRDTGEIVVFCSQKKLKGLAWAFPMLTPYALCSRGSVGPPRGSCWAVVKPNAGSTGQAWGSLSLIWSPCHYGGRRPWLNERVLPLSFP